jgi:hypothetical protein
VFRQLAQFFPGSLPAALPSAVPPPFPFGSPNANAVLSAHPYVLSRTMERAWIEHELGATAPPPPTAGMPVNVFLNEGNGAPIDGLPLALPIIGLPFAAPWDHLIYGYFVENTRVLEIFRRIVREFAVGERLKPPPDGSDPAMVWVRTAEDLWMRDWGNFSIANIVSQMRPDFGAVRRNAYFRMFGIDLNHGTDDGRPYTYEKSEVANRDFVRLLESLIESVWVARVNRANAVGTNPTDPAEIARMCGLLQELLNLRKQGGQLRREEFVIVSMMSWFHLAVSFDSPIVRLLNANAATEGERLIRLGERVGVAAHPRAREFFRLAQDMSALLKLIESGMFSNAPTVPWLYAAWSPVAQIMDRIVNDWSIVTGRDLKGAAVRTNTASSMSTASASQRPRPSITPTPATSNHTPATVRS